MVFKDVWDIAAAYSANDVVSRSYGLYAALVAVPVNQDPVIAPSYIGSPVSVGAVTHASPQPTAWGGNSVYKAFTTGGSPITVDMIRLSLTNSGHAAGHVTVGIASAIGANPNAVTFLANGSVAATIPAINGTIDCVLPASIVLAASTTYYFVAVSTDVGGAPGAAGLAFADTAASVSGGIASTATNVGDTDGVTSGAWTLFAGYTFLFNLFSGARAPYWRQIASVDAPPKVVSKSVNYTMVPTDGTVLATAAITVTLPAAAAAIPNRRYTVKNTIAGTVTIGGTVDGVVNKTLTVQYSSIDVVSDGTNWYEV